MMLHPNAAIRVLRNELERLDEALAVLQGADETALRKLEAREVSYMATLRLQAERASAAQIIDQILREAAELREAIDCIETVFEYDKQMALPFDAVAA